MAVPDVRCIECSGTFVSDAMDDDITSCPLCGTEAMPCFTDDDVKIEINWHELKLLGQAAERWAEHVQKSSSKHNTPNSQRIINAICGRLMAQYPDREPLTLSGEIASLRQEFGDVEVFGFVEDDQANDDER